MKKEQLETEKLRAAADGYAPVGAISAEDSCAELPIGEGKFTPNGNDCYEVKRVQVPKASASRHAGNKISFVVTKGTVVIGGKEFKNKNLGGEHTTENTPIFVTQVGRYKKLTSYKIEENVEVAPRPQVNETV